MTVLTIHHLVEFKLTRPSPLLSGKNGVTSRVAEVRPETKIIHQKIDEISVPEHATKIFGYRHTHTYYTQIKNIPSLECCMNLSIPR